jgi:hypothetical protein
MVVNLVIVATVKHDDFNLTLGTLDLIASLLAATLYQGNHDGSHKL